MWRTCILAWGVAGVLVLAAEGLANPIVIPQPPKEAVSKPLQAPVVIKRGALADKDRAIQARIIIPRSLLPATAEKAVKPTLNPALNPPPVRQQSGGPPLGTIIAGLALSLAAVSVVFVVRGNRSAKTIAAAVLIGAIGLSAWATSWANAPPPLPVRPRPGEQPKIVVEFVDDADEVVLELREVGLGR